MKPIKKISFFIAGLMLLASHSRADDYAISVDAGSDRGALNRFWQRSVGSCHIGMVNGSHYRDPETSIALNHRKAYLLAAKELGFKGVRAHGIFLDDVGIYHEDFQGNPQYSWEKYDELMDFIVRKCGMHPIMELSFTPTDLASDPGATYAFWYAGNTSVPKDYVKWQNLVYQVVRHSLERYGKSEVDQWNWEVYNEPNLSFPGGPEEYCKLYDYAAEGAVAANPDVKIGGSAMDASGVSGYFYQFLDHCRSGTNYANGRTGSRIAFFSHHVYPDNFGSVGDAHFYRDRHNFFTDEIGKYYSQMGLEQMMTETGTSYYVFGRNDGYYESHDSAQSASFVAQTVQSLLYNNVPPPTAWSYWVISDLWEEGFQAPGDKLSYFGIMGTTLRKDNIFKPVYHAFKLLTMLGDRLLDVSGGSVRPDFKGANAIATKTSDGTQIQALVFNQDYYTGQSHPDDTLADNVALTISHIPAGWTRVQVQVFGVDKYRSNSYSTWVKAGSPEYPTSATWTAMKSDQNLIAVKEPFVVPLNNGTFRDTLTAYHTGVYLYVLTNPDAQPQKKCDLTVTDILWTPRTPPPGTPVVFSAVVKNIGPMGSPTNTHHGVAFYVNGVKKTWSAVRNTSLPPGASAMLTASGGVDGSAAWSAGSGTFKIRAEIDDVGIIPEEREDNNTFTKSLEAGTSVALPAGWHDADVGAVLAAGSAGFRSGLFSVTGSGKDIWDTEDGFHYAFQRGSGNMTVSARVETQENTSPWAKAGVMIRESETETSKFADVVLTPGNGVSFQWRSINGGPCGNVNVAAVGPVYLKLARFGNEFRGYYSSDGTTWTQIGGPVTIAMGYDASAGLCVTSTNDGQLSGATFFNVNTTFARKEGDPHGLVARYYKGINADFNKNYFKAEKIVANVDFDWGSGGPDALLGTDLFSVVWKGSVTPKISQRFDFHTLTDDGVQLWVNGRLLVDQWVDQGPTEHTGSIELSSGTAYPIEMHYYEKGLGAVAKLMWSGPSLPKEVVPPECLTPGRPDLVVADVLITPANPVAGDEVSFAATIKNAGLSPSPNGAVHTVAFYVDGRKFAWSTSQQESIPPGALAYVRADGGVNGAQWTAEPGPHSIMAMVDDNDTIAETDEFNNRTEKSVVCAPPAHPGRGLYSRYFNNKDFTDMRLTRVDPKIKFNWIHLSPDLSLGSDTFSVRWTGAVTPKYSETYTFHTETDDGARLWVNGALIVDQWTNQGVTEHTGTISLQAGRPYSIRMDYFDETLGAVANLYWSSPSQAKEIIPADCLYPNGYEAEQGTVGGAAAVSSYFVGQMHNPGAWVQINGVDGLEGGPKTLNIRYATDEANGLKSLYVNGTFIRHVQFPVTGGWETFGLKQEPILLLPGTNNVVRLENGAGDAGGVNIDSFIIE